MADEIRLGIALPVTDGSVPTKFFDSFLAIIKPRSTTYVRPGKVGPIDLIRNNLVETALAANLTHLWMSDTDQIYPSNVIQKLLAHDLPVVAAKVHRRYPPYDPILLKGDDFTYEKIPDEEWEKGGLVEVDATGMGSVLFNMSVFHRIKPPWFKWTERNGQQIGEDIYFWDKCKKAGFRIHVDCDINIGHLAEMVITEESYWAYKFK